MYCFLSLCLLWVRMSPSTWMNVCSPLNVCVYVCVFVCVSVRVSIFAACWTTVLFLSPSRPALCVAFWFGWIQVYLTKWDLDPQRKWYPAGFTSKVFPMVLENVRKKNAMIFIFYLFFKTLKHTLSLYISLHVCIYIDNCFKVYYLFILTTSENMRNSFWNQLNNGYSHSKENLFFCLFLLFFFKSSFNLSFCGDYLFVRLLQSRCAMQGALFRRFGPSHYKT